MKLVSSDFSDGQTLPLKATSAHLGGLDVSPDFEFSGVPAEARSLALTCYDPDAPTGSGFWHWVVVNIPAAASGRISSAALPEGAVTAPNDAATNAYFGGLPPEGHPAHRYVFTLHALSTDAIPIENAPGAFVRFAIKTNEIATASLTAMFANTPDRG